MESLDEAKGIKIIKKALLVLGIVYAIIVFVLIIKVINNEHCGRNTYTDYDNGEVTAGITLDAEGETVYQHNPFHNGCNVKHWNFCFSHNATAATELHIINSADEILAHVIIGTGYEKSCYRVNFPENETFNYLGIRCDTCSAAAKEVTFYEELAGTTVERVFKGGSAFIVTQDNTLDWVVYGYPSCWESVKYFTIWYLTGGIALIIILGLIYGVKKTEEMIKRD